MADIACSTMEHSACMPPDFDRPTRRPSSELQASRTRWTRWAYWAVWRGSFCSEPPVVQRTPACRW